MVEVKIAGRPVSMHIDTGAAVSNINEEVYSQLPRQRGLGPCTLELKTYSGTPLETRGQATVVVEYEGQKTSLPVIVVPGTQPCLLSRYWLAELKLDWSQVLSVEVEQEVSGLLEKYKEVFSSEVGLIKGPQAQVVLKDGARPVFCKARPVPYALKDAVELEIQNLKERGILEPVLQSDWATPLVVVPKAEHKSVMDEMLKGLDGVACYVDDVLIAGASLDECLKRVEAVLGRFQSHGVRLKQEK